MSKYFSEIYSHFKDNNCLSLMCFERNDFHTILKREIDTSSKLEEIIFNILKEALDTDSIEIIWYCTGDYGYSTSFTVETCENEVYTYDLNICYLH